MTICCFFGVLKFNLVDSDEEEFGPEETLTHFGQSLADADGNWSDDSDDGRLAGKRCPVDTML